MGAPRTARDPHDEQAVVLAFAPPYEQDGTTVITATAARTHSAVRDGQRPEKRFDAQMSDARPMGAFVVRDGRVRWHPVVDVTKVITTAELVVGSVLVARRLAARPSGATALVTMGPGGWVSMKGGAVAVRPARRLWRQASPAAPPSRRLWWARLLSATAVEKLIA